MEPKTLHDAIKFFDRPENVRAYMVARRWPDGIVRCPQCGSDRVKFSEKHNRWQCAAHHAKRQFTLKVGTIFEDSPIALEKWLLAMWMIVNCKNGVSSWEIHRTIGVTQKTAWFMLHRIREVLAQKSAQTPDDQLGGFGAVEVDETFVGGKVKNMHKSRRLKLNQIRNSVNRPDHYYGKTIVMGIVDRNLRTVRATVVPNTKRETLQAQILKEVFPGSKIYTDEHVGYMGLEKKFAHEVVNHLETYVRGRVHTNGIENFWSLLKRGLTGTYVAVEPFHLERYVDEQAFRYNNRATKDNKITDADRFDYAVTQILGRRLTYKELTGKTTERVF
jgi:transposase-like protein